jgi:hypothetical protein
MLLKLSGKCPGYGMKLLIRGHARVEMFSEHLICKLICIGCRNEEQKYVSTFTCVKRSLVLTMVPNINLEQVAYPLLVSTHFAITLNVKHNNLMLSFDVWSSLVKLV